VLAQGRFAQALAALDSGDRGRLTSSTALYEAAASELDDPRDKGQAAMIRSTVAFIEGLYDDAASLSEEAVVLGRASGDFNADLLYYAQGLWRAVDQGQASDVLPLLLGSTDYQHIASFAAGTALCAALAGEADHHRNDDLSGRQHQSCRVPDRWCDRRRLGRHLGGGAEESHRPPAGARGRRRRHALRQYDAGVQPQHPVLHRVAHRYRA
jgi:hypothetical protein